MRMKLNKRAIDRATYQGPGADYRWQTDLPGFGLRIYPSGRKSFVVTYRCRGRQRFFTLGRYGELTLHEAYTMALEALGQARRGEDPAAIRLLALTGCRRGEILAETIGATVNAAMKRAPKAEVVELAKAAGGRR